METPPFDVLVMIFVYKNAKLQKLNCWLCSNVWIYLFVLTTKIFSPSRDKKSICHAIYGAYTMCKTKILYSLVGENIFCSKSIKKIKADFSLNLVDFSEKFFNTLCISFEVIYNKFCFPVLQNSTNKLSNWN